MPSPLMRTLLLAPLALTALAAVASAQDASISRATSGRGAGSGLAVAPVPAPSVPTSPPRRSPASPAAPAPGDTGFAPTWETQKQARTYLLAIPAPRGQIMDRNGTPLAQTRVSYN